MGQLDDLTAGGTDTGGREPGTGAPLVPRIERRRGLPGSRAVIGALLIAAATVGTFATYLGTTREPSTRYLVAVVEILPGTRLADAQSVNASFEAVAMDLAPQVAARAFEVAQAPQLVGRRLVVPLAPGELLTRSAVVAEGEVPDAETVSFPVPRAAALDGALRVGDRIDVLATYRAGEGYTAYVLRSVPLLAVSGEDAGGVGGSRGGDLVLTVAVSDPRDVQALVHAVQVAEVVVTRSTAAPDRLPAAPDAYVPSPTAPGPQPDPAGAGAGAG